MVNLLGTETTLPEDLPTAKTAPGTLLPARPVIVQSSIALAVAAILANTIGIVGAIVAQRRAATAATAETARVRDSVAAAAFHHRHSKAPLSEDYFIYIIPERRAPMRGIILASPKRLWLVPRGTD